MKMNFSKTIVVLALSVSIEALGQEYSKNAVGFITLTLKPGFNLIANQLYSGNNTIDNLFKELPDGTQVYKFDGTRFTTATKDETFLPASAAAIKVDPGEGAFVRNPTSSDLTGTFIGEVPQGTRSVQIPLGLSIISPIFPIPGQPDFQFNSGDQMYVFDPATQRYRTSTFDDGDWIPGLRTLSLGQAVFFNRTGNAGVWTKTFNITP